MRILLAVIFLNEERYLPTFLESLAGQSRPPDRVMLVDDGSSDRSVELAAEFATCHPWAEVLRRPARPPERDRLVAGSVWTTFQWAVDSLGPDAPYDIVAKVDADLQFTPHLLEELETRFASDPSLGMAGPYLAELSSDGTPVRMRWRPEHVAGATKFYRRRCYDDVYPLPPMLNFDMVDEVKARSRGWRTASFEASEGDPLHLRRHGTHDGALRGFRRWGTSEYVSGTHPLLIAYVGLQRLRDRPVVLGTLNYFLGWCLAAVKRTPRYPAELRGLRRQEQLRRVRARLSGVAR